ncbi:MAG: carcinine hydrolase/isopenicillin-N N-acyltransferase family protein [Candidatus Methanofastidiosia archaeon]|jgi:hypothetical protein
MTLKENTVLNKGFMTVRHLIMDGTNLEIGKTLAEIAMNRHNFSKDKIKCSNPVIAGARKEYYARNYPVHAERAKGVAKALNVEYTDNEYDTTSIQYNQEMPMPLGCSTVYYPPGTTTDKAGYISRNFDFPTGSLPEIMGIPIPPQVQNQVRPLMADPYIIESYPDEGFSSVCLTSFDVLSGVLEGVNSCGVMVAINGDETAPIDPVQMGNIDRVGLHELQAMRLILDTCATAKEAKTTLLTHKHYYNFMPCHYIIADLNSCFVFEVDHSRNAEYIVPGGDTPMVLTNHLLYMYPTVETMPQETDFLKAGTSSFQRFKKLALTLNDTPSPYSTDFMKKLNASVSVSQVVSWIPEEQRRQLIEQPGLSRTLWHNLINNKTKTMDIKFYTGEEYTKGSLTEKYADYMQIALKC